MGKIYDNDYDTWQNNTYGYPYGLYMYYLDKELYGSGQVNTSIIGNCPAIVSVQYAPFVYKENLFMDKIPYDIERFGETGRVSGEPYVYRIMGHTTKKKVLGTFKTYKNVKTNIGGKRDWRNESKLYNYPYSFAMIYDYIGEPLQIKYNLCPYTESEVAVRGTVSDRCSYNIFVTGYKNDNLGVVEGVQNQGGKELPCSSSAYNTYVASSKNQYQAQQNANTLNMWSGIAQGGLTALGSALTLNLGGALGGIGTMVDAGITAHNQTQQLLAQQKDLKDTPPSLISMGSDVVHSLEMSGKEVHLQRFTCDEVYKEKIGDFFALYGYKQNRLFRPKIRHRYYYNYIKCVDVNIRGSRVPKQHLEKLKAIYNNGVTIWHITRDNVTVGDYSMDNYEYNGQEKTTELMVRKGVASETTRSKSDNILCDECEI